MALTAVLHLVLQTDTGLAEALHGMAVLSQQVEHQAKGCLASYTRQFGKFTHRLFKQLRGVLIVHLYGLSMVLKTAYYRSFLIELTDEIPLLSDKYTEFLDGMMVFCGIFSIFAAQFSKSVVL